jgi:hypothetical protein
MRDADDVVYWLQERALRRYGATMNAAHTKTQEWLWADEITRLREENKRLREALKPFAEKEYAYEGWADIARAEVWLNVRDIRAAAAAIREGGKDD